MIYWDESYRIGIDAIDDQHQKIIQSLNLVHDVIEAKDYTNALPVLNDVVLILCHHLAYEEHLLLRNSEFHEHLAEHGYIRLRLINCVLGKDAIESKCEVVQKLLSDWFVHHILYTDRRDLIRLKRNGLLVSDFADFDTSANTSSTKPATAATAATKADIDAAVAA